MYIFKPTVIAFVTLLLAGNINVMPTAGPEAFQGAWQIVSVVRSGVEDKGPIGQTVRFTANEVHFEAYLILPRTFRDANRRVPS